MTGIIELLQSDGITPKRVSGNEHHSPCPVCGGRDRFVIWPDKGDTGRAWCRQCDLKVDGIGYLMAVHGMTFKEAAESVGKGVRFPVRNDRERKPIRAALAVKSSPIPEPEEKGEPSGIWSETAEKFISWAADNLRRNPQQRERLRTERGISPNTAEAWRLGWNPAPLKRPGNTWGLDGELSFPAGVVIPNIRNGVPVSVKIRKESGEPKYHLVRGSKVSPFILPGEVRGTVAVVEGEFDALLLWEVARDVLTPVAFGGCANHPDGETVEFIAKAGILLNCLDNDGPGDAAGGWWKDWFPDAFRWKPSRKDPGEMYKSGEDVRRWIFEGIRTVLRQRKAWPGKLDFYEALDALSDPFPPELLRGLSEEETERAAIMAESGVALDRVKRYIREFRKDGRS